MSAPTTGPGTGTGTGTDGRERVAAVVIGAMDEEVAPFLRRAATDLASARGGSGTEAPRPRDVGGARLWRLTLGGAQILLVRSGIGLVNAASAATIALHEVAPDAIVSSGSAGGLGRRVHVGEVVVGRSATYSAADARAFGYALGQVPGMPLDYPADPALLERATAVIDGGPVVVAGQVTSGDTFVDGERLVPLRAAFPDAAATDMESTAIAQVAHSFGVPFLTARGISDLCGPDAGTEHPVTLDAVAEASAVVVLAALGIAA